MAAVGQALREGRAALERAGIASARLDAEVLLGHALGRERGEVLLHPAQPVAARHLAAFRRALARRAQREPVARITGVQEFWSLPFRVGPATLVPRPDSETVIEEALHRIGETDRHRTLRVLDLGTGSGCLLLALLSELRNARGVGADVSVAALTLAEGNARALGLAKRAAFRRFDWAKGVAGGLECFDVILCNPPYIASGEVTKLVPDVAHFEPRGALDGGGDGLDAYRAIVPLLADLAAPEGALVVFEAGQGQAPDVKALLRGAGAKSIRVRRDLSGIERVVSATMGGRGAG